MVRLPQGWKLGEVTRAKGILGTAPYMSPEQSCGLAADWRTDVWAFGCVLFELVTGQRAFSGNSRTELVRAILDAKPSWSELPAALPASVVDLLRRCLAKDVHLRPLMSHIRIVLDEALAGLRTISGPAEAAPTTLGIDPTTLDSLDSRATLLSSGPLPSPREIEAGGKPQYRSLRSTEPASPGPSPPGPLP